MKWKKIPIKDICIGIYDGPHATPKTSESGPVFLGIQNFNNGRLDFSEIRHISEEDFSKWTKRVEPRANDIVFSYEATLNLYAIIPENLRCCLGRRLALIRIDETKAHYKFVYYYFQSNSWKAEIKKNTVLGATVDRIPLIKFPDFLIELPPLELQYKIADYLSEYDSLIENNKKQIKLLEEAAQRLYKEWFVKLHFPGWKNTQSIKENSIKWKEGKLQDIAEFKRGKIITKADVKCGSVPVIAGGINPAYYHDEANTKAPVVTISASGANAGYTSLYPVDIFASDCLYIDSESTDYVYYVYCFLKHSSKQIENLQKGSAQPHVYAKDINGLKLIIPNNKYLDLFTDIVSTYFKQIQILQRKCILLSEARYRLLPKLMSGEIEV